jgi:hypothetical protein
METSHRETTKETEYSMLYDEESILFFYFRLFKDSLFCTFSITVATWNNLLGLIHNLT